MASHFKWYPSSEEVTVPWMAQYTFPSQANKSVKMTPRIPPKNGSTFFPGQVIRAEFPAQGYMNPQNTTFTFDVCLTGFNTMSGSIVRFQNNINSIFTRVRLLYGATPLEDMINYNVIVRNLTEWTGTNQTATIDNSSIAVGIGGCVPGIGPTFSAATTLGDIQPGLVNVRQNYIQGIDASLPNAAPFNSAVPGGPVTSTCLAGAGSVPNQLTLTGFTPPTLSTYFAVTNSTPGATGPAPGQIPVTTRRYQLNLAFGLFTQGKLIPLKFMASQLAIEWTLASDQECIFVGSTTAANITTPPTYAVGNFNMIPEILEFDASYDAMFLRGLREGGVPIKFSTWHTFIFSTNGASNVNLAIQERSRSVKALFAVQRRSPVSRYTDSHACFFDSSAYDVNGNTLQTYQYRIGGRYFPAAPVQTSDVIGGKINNGGCEAWVELEKALNIVGDYRLAPNVNSMRWALSPSSFAITNGGVVTRLNELDYMTSIINYSDKGHPQLVQSTRALVGAGASARSGNLGSSCFTAAICLETSNGMEISGLNAEEQSDISFLCNWASAQDITNVIEVYTFIDAMIILRENNVLELIQ
jgi:hypothetical protein